jgi:hypothetical protein
VLRRRPLPGLGPFVPSTAASRRPRRLCLAVPAERAAWCAARARAGGSRRAVCAVASRQQLNALPLFLPRAPAPLQVGVADETNDEEFKSMLVRRPAPVVRRYVVPTALRLFRAQTLGSAFRAHCAHATPPQSVNKANAEQLGLVHKVRPFRAIPLQRFSRCRLALPSLCRLALPSLCASSLTILLSVSEPGAVQGRARRACRRAGGHGREPGGVLQRRSGQRRRRS